LMATLLYLWFEVIIIIIIYILYFWNMVCWHYLGTGVAHSGLQELIAKISGILLVSGLKPLIAYIISHGGNIYTMDFTKCFPILSFPKWLFKHLPVYHCLWEIEVCL
jgi:hypothetical protein